MNSIEVDVECRNASCDSDTVMLRYDEIYTLGQDDPVDLVFDGAQCRECGLLFVDEEVNELGREKKPEVELP